jgi:hypothetical protein
VRSLWRSVTSAGDKVRAKVHEKGNELLLAACDKELLGKTFKEGELCLHVSQSFYGGELVNEKKLSGLMDSSTIGNLVGDRVIALAVQKKLVDSKRVLRIKKIPHAQFARITKS